MLAIDCSEGEGGGQLMRTALGMAALLRKPVQLSGIRSKRPKPGLQPQHLTAVNTLKTICNAKVNGLMQGTQHLTFETGNVENISLNVNIGTAGSVCLLLQTLYLPCMLKEIKLRITGGTDVPYAPSFKYMDKVFFRAAKETGAKFSAELVKYGFYPKGNGIVSFKSMPAKFPLKPLVLKELGSLQHIEIYSHSASLPKEVALNQRKAAERELQSFGVDIIEKTEHAEKSTTIGSAVDVFAEFSSGAIIGANALGVKGKPAEEVGKEAAQKLVEEIKAERPVDSHLSDQLIPFMALAKGFSEIHITKLTQHCLTNIDICQKLLNVKFEVEGALNEKAVIKVEGMGYKP